MQNVVSSKGWRSKWRLRLFTLAAVIVVVIMLPPSGGSVSGMRSLPRAILREDWGPLTGATLEEAAKSKEAEDRAYLAALIDAYGLTPVLIEWLDKWWHPCWPTAALRWYPDDFPEPLPWIEDNDPATGCDYSTVWVTPSPGGTEANPAGLWELWPFYEDEDLAKDARGQEAADRQWIAEQLERNPNEDLEGRLCWPPILMPWYPVDFPEPAKWIDDLDADTSCEGKEGTDDVDLACTWDGSTVDSSWLAIELDRLKASLEASIALNAPGMSLEEASVQDWAGKINVGQSVWMLDLPTWARNMITPMDCELVAAPVDQTPALVAEGTKWGSITDWAAWSNQAIAEDREWIAAETAARGSPPGEEWDWAPCWPPDAMPWYPADFPPPMRWKSYETGCD